MGKRVTNRVWLAVSQQLRCYWCNQLTRPKMGWQNSATTEHLIPKSMGGIDIPPNVVSACARCNRLRGVDGVEEFKLKATQFEPDKRKVRVALAEEQALKKSLGIKKVKKTKKIKICEPVTLNSQSSSPHNPFEPGTLFHLLFEKRNSEMPAQVVDSTDLETS